MAFRYADNYSSTIATIGAGTGQTSFTVTSASGFPTLGTGDFTKIRINDAGGAGVAENVTCTGISGTTVTCVATTIAHTAGDTVHGAIMDSGALTQVKDDAVSGYPETSHTGAGALVLSALNRIAITAADATFTLANGTYRGQLCRIQMVNSSSKRATIDPVGATTINGLATRIMHAGESAQLSWTGSTWEKTAGLSVPMMAVMYLNTGQASIAVATNVKVLLETAGHSTITGMIDVANNRVNVLRPGLYTVCANLNFAPTAAGAGTQVKATIRGGSAGTDLKAELSTSVPINSYAGLGPQITDVFSLNDQITLNAFTAGATRDIVGGFLTSLSVIEHPGW